MSLSMIVKTKKPPMRFRTGSLKTKKTTNQNPALNRASPIVVLCASLGLNKRSDLKNIQFS